MDEPRSNDPNEQQSWVAQNRILSVFGGAAGLVLAAAGALLLHLATSGNPTPAGPRHETAGDFVFFALVSILVTGATIVILLRIRAAERVPRS